MPNMHISFTFKWKRKWNTKVRHARGHQSESEASENVLSKDGSSTYSTYSRLIRMLVGLLTSCGLISANVTDKQTHGLQLTLSNQ